MSKTTKPQITYTDKGTQTFGVNRHVGTLIEIHGGTLDGQVIACFNGTTYREICGYCDGTGYRPGYEFTDNGRCWPCNYQGVSKKIGDGGIDELIKVLERRAYGAAYRARKAEEKAAVARNEHATWFALHPEIHDMVATVTAMSYDEFHIEHAKRGGMNPLMMELASAAGIRIITDKQVELLKKQIIEHAAKVEADAVKKAEMATREFLGAVGDKLTVTGTLGRPFHSENDWGSSTLYKLTTANGDVVSWWRSGYHTYEEGETVTLRGTVKKLSDTEKYGKETVLTRCKFIEEN